MRRAVLVLALVQLACNGGRERYLECVKTRLRAQEERRIYDANTAAHAKEMRRRGDSEREVYAYLAVRRADPSGFVDGPTEIPECKR